MTDTKPTREHVERAELWLNSLVPIGTTETTSLAQQRGVGRMRAPKMKPSERKARRCAACGKPVGGATIVAGGPYPTAPLCLACGGSDSRLTCEEVFEMIRARESA